jgi:hypothetical protein
MTLVPKGVISAANRSHRRAFVIEPVCRALRLIT